VRFSCSQVDNNQPLREGPEHFEYPSKFEDTLSMPDEVFAMSLLEPSSGELIDARHRGVELAETLKGESFEAGPGIGPRRNGRGRGTTDPVALQQQ
jgi:hypothetical protein